MEVEIVKFDNNGRGIGYINNKIIFIPKSIPGDVIEAEKTLEKSNYLEGTLKKIIKPSKKRVKIPCPYFNECGGCDLMNISLSNMLEYKLSIVNDILKTNKIDFNVTKIIKSNDNHNYRNKITLKIINGKYGYYENHTHKLIEIDKCLLCHDSINSVIKDLNILNIYNGEIVIRCNYKGELILSIDSNDEVNNIDLLSNKYPIVGIIHNGNAIYGQDFFIDKVNNYLFKVSYDSFFQVNRDICSKIIEAIKDFSVNSKNILDFYCGVGLLGISATHDSNSVLGVEVNENAINDAKMNANLNGIKNTKFICADTKNVINEITDSYDTIILDPPRSGVDKSVIQKIIDTNINNIIYVSCNPITLARDLKLLMTDYLIVDITLYDMFPNTHHCESVCILERR